jgi:uncharacterized membrane protein YfcA
MEARGLMPEIFMGLSPASWLLLALIGICVGTMHTLGGLAGGVMLSILLTPLIGVEQVVPVVSVALLFGGLSRLWVFRHSIEWRVFRSIMITGAPGIVAGSAIFSFLPPRAIAATLGIFLLVTTFGRRAVSGQRFKIGPGGFAILGSVFGVVSGMTVGGGMLLVPFLLGAGLTGERFVAIVAAVGFTMSLVKVASFGSLSLLGAQTIFIGSVTGLCVIPGTYVGHWIIRNTPLRIHTTIVETIVVIGALFFLWSAFAPA